MRAIVDSQTESACEGHPRPPAERDDPGGLRRVIETSRNPSSPNGVDVGKRTRRVWLDVLLRALSAWPC